MNITKFIPLMGGIWERKGLKKKTEIRNKVYDLFDWMMKTREGTIGCDRRREFYKNL